ncbi:MAG: CinA family protein [Selenomonadaceae bacterium]|nr:CinA family protein [Selenomonadaceae bacterium]
MNLENKLGKILTDKKLTISCAESCTGGLLTSRLTDVAGSSNYVQGSIVSYSNEIKNSVLKVDAETLKNFGAVSEQTARQMSANVRELFKTDIGVGVTGIAGPGGGTAEKPVGTVYISVSNSDKTFVKKFNFGGSRKEIKNQSCDAAMSMVINILKN